MRSWRLRKRHFYVLFCLIVILYISGLFEHLQERDYSNFEYPYQVNINLLVNQFLHNENPDIPPINVYNFTFKINSSDTCKIDSDYSDKIRLVYLIKSAPKNFNKRLAIRSSWGFENRFSDVEIRRIFLLGEISNKYVQSNIVKEMLQFNDIVQANFVDSYFNNTIKTMMGFKWAVTHCNDSKFYMFVDDDYYVSTRNVLRFVRNPTNYPKYIEEQIDQKLPFNRKMQQLMDFELPEDVKLYAGHVVVSSPLRHITSKWYVSLDEYPYDQWPPYVTAGAYVLSRAALLHLYYASFYTKHFRFDDIYLAFVARKIQIEPFHCEQFCFYRKNNADYKYIIASHGFDDPEELIEFWTKQKSLGNA